MSIYDLIIIGAGPAGLTCGLYAGRFRMNALILEKMQAGGQIVLSSTIDNFPGFPAGSSTQELIDKIKAQAEEVGIKTESAEALEITQGPANFFSIKTTEKTYEAKSVVIACGAQPKKLSVPGEDKFLGRGVSYCGTCDGPLFKGKDIIVVGGGDRAIEEAIYLSGYAKTVSVLHRRNELRASKILEEKARSNSKIKFVLESQLTEIKGAERVEGVRIRNAKNGAETHIACQGVFVFVGIIPQTAFLKKFLHLDDLGFIITDENSKTSLSGIFACGDCCKKGLYQVVSACAEGAQAADSAHKYLLNL